MAGSSGGGGVVIRVDATAANATLGRIRDLAPILRTRLQAAFTAESASIVAAIRAGAMAGRAAAPSPHHLRAGIASSVRSGGGTPGPGVVVSASAQMARAWDARGWSHPIFGRPDRASQVGAPGYFQRPVAAHRAAITEAVTRAFQSAVDSATS